MTEYILGIACYYHDAAACLLKDGELIAAAEEERFNRKKHYSGFPHLSIKYCLEEADIDIKDVQYIVYYEKPFIKFNRILETSIAQWPKSFGVFRRAIPMWLKGRLDMRKHISKELKIEPSRVYFSEHHLSHSASAFFLSPFKEAAILTEDGVGEWATTTLGHGKDNKMIIDREIQFPHSLGLLYSALTAYLGFRVNDAEWKVMGLAPYGEPKYVDRFSKLVDVKDDGSFRLNMKYFSYIHSHKYTINRKFGELLGRPMRKKDEEIDEFYTDMASSGQKVVEDIIVKIADFMHKTYKTDTLVIAGGVGLNSVANWRILEKTGFKNIFIQPAAGDSGAALGAAFAFYHLALGKPRKYEMKHALLGPSYTDKQIKETLDSYDAKYTEYKNDKELIDATAKMLAEDKVIGWFQGRMEFGPRALGNRSILANPQNPKMKEILNSKVKFREKFRPFAPSVLKEKTSKYFDIDIDAPYMLLIPQVRKEWQKKLPAITHVDGTARLQTVDKETNPKYHALLSSFEKKAGVPVVLNTSFNVRGEPIVCTPEDAYSCYMRTGIDALVVGNCILTEKNQEQVENFKELNIVYIKRDEGR
ncbi:MAG: carbamoyltransferase [Acidobacteria bacterium]|nr:carbamoyltransferase [Acidobacteriota bacterium]